MSDQYPTFAALRNALENKEVHALEQAGLISPDVADYLEQIRRTYEPGDGDHYREDRPAAHYHNAESYVNIVRRELNKTLYAAVQNGNRPVIERAMGLIDNDGKDTPFAEALKLEDIIHGDSFKMLVFTGGQGGGKSYFAYLLAKYKVNLCRRDDIPVRAITNSLSAVELNEDLEFVGSPRELIDYRMTNPGQIVFVLDEASSFFDSKAGGHGSDLAKFVPVLRRLRKMDILPIIVSHRAMDIGTDIRELESVVFVHKPDEDTAVFYENERNDELQDKMFEISGYSTDERYDYESEDLFISWDWDGLEEIYENFQDPQAYRKIWEEKGVVKDLKEVREEIEQRSALEDERRELIEQCAELDYSQSEIAEFAGVGQSTVDRILNNP